MPRIDPDKFMLSKHNVTDIRTVLPSEYRSSNPKRYTEIIKHEIMNTVNAMGSVPLTTTALRMVCDDRTQNTQGKRRTLFVTLKDLKNIKQNSPIWKGRAQAQINAAAAAIANAPAPVIPPAAAAAPTFVDPATNPAAADIVNWLNAIDDTESDDEVESESAAAASAVAPTDSAAAVVGSTLRSISEPESDRAESAPAAPPSAAPVSAPAAAVDAGAPNGPGEEESGLPVPPPAALTPEANVGRKMKAAH